MTTDVPTRLEQAGLPAGDLLSRRNALPAPLQALHRRVLLTLAQTGQPPTDDEPSTWAGELHLELDTALAISRAGQWSWQPAGAGVFVGSTSGGPVQGGRLTNSCCPVRTSPLLPSPGMWSPTAMEPGSMTLYDRDSEQAKQQEDATMTEYSPGAPRRPPSRQQEPPQVASPQPNSQAGGGLTTAIQLVARAAGPAAYRPLRSPSPARGRGKRGHRRPTRRDHRRGPAGPGCRTRRGRGTPPHPGHHRTWHVGRHRHRHQP